MSILQSAANFLKEKVGKTPLEKNLSESTSDENWNASTKILLEIAEASYNYDDFNVITKYIAKKLDKKKKDVKWRVIVKTLSLIEFLLKNGSPRIVQEFKDEVFMLRSFQDFTFIEGTNDRGAAVREKAKAIVDLLQDDSKLESEREHEKKLRDKLQTTSLRGIGSNGPADRHKEDEASWKSRGKYEGYGSGGPDKKKEDSYPRGGGGQKAFGELGSYDSYPTGKNENRAAARKDEKPKKEEDFVVKGDKKPATTTAAPSDLVSEEPSKEKKTLKKLEKPGEHKKDGKGPGDDLLDFGAPQAQGKASQDDEDDDDDFFKDIGPGPQIPAQPAPVHVPQPVAQPVQQPKPQASNFLAEQLTFSLPVTTTAQPAAPVQPAHAPAQPTQAAPSQSLSSQLFEQASLNLNSMQSQQQRLQQQALASAFQGFGQPAMPAFGQPGMPGLAGYPPQQAGLMYPGMGVGMPQAYGMQPVGFGIPQTMNPLMNNPMNFPVTSTAAPVGAPRASPNKRPSVQGEHKKPATTSLVSENDFDDFVTANQQKVEAKGYGDIAADLISLDGLKSEQDKKKQDFGAGVNVGGYVSQHRYF